MNSRLSVFVVSVILFTILGCEKKDECTPQVNDDCVCIEIYDPVCGCDGVTYGNACHASCVGISSTKGECVYDHKALEYEWSFIGYKEEEKLTNDEKPKHNYPNMSCIFGLNNEGRRTISGKSSINFFSGDYIIRKQKGSTGYIQNFSFITTKIAGPPEALNYETRYLDRLNEASYYELKNEKVLYLHYSNEGKSDVMVFFRK